MDCKLYFRKMCTRIADIEINIDFIVKPLFSITRTFGHKPTETIFMRNTFTMETENRMY